MTNMRLQRFLSRAGIASRRHCEDIILAGRVSVNGSVVTELGTKVDSEKDSICLDGKKLQNDFQDVYLMLHKPLDYVTTMEDPQNRNCVASLVPLQEHPGLFPVGRLDRQTTGLLLFTTNGVMGCKLLHPRHHVTKTYLARVTGVPTRHETHLLRTGVTIHSGTGKMVATQPAEVELLEGSTNALLRISIKQGINRQIRKMCSVIGHPVISLHRISFGPLELGTLKAGKYRYLSEEEISALNRATTD